MHRIYDYILMYINTSIHAHRTNVHATYMCVCVCVYIYIYIYARMCV